MKQPTIKEYQRIVQGYALIYGHDLFVRNGEVSYLGDVFADCYFDIESELIDLTEQFLEETKELKDLKEGSYGFELLLNVQDNEDWIVLENSFQFHPQPSYEPTDADFDLPF